MAKEVKLQQAMFRLVAQSVSEFLRWLKIKKEMHLDIKDYNTANDLLQLQMRIEEDPYNHVIVSLKEGREDEFRELLDTLDVDYIYANASYLEAYTGCYIMDMEAYKRLTELEQIYAVNLDAEKEWEEDDPYLEHSTEEEEEEPDKEESDKDELPEEEDTDGSERVLFEEEATQEKKTDRKRTQRSTGPQKEPAQHQEADSPYPAGNSGMDPYHSDGNTDMDTYIPEEGLPSPGTSPYAPEERLLSPEATEFVFGNTDTDVPASGENTFSPGTPSYVPEESLLSPGTHEMPFTAESIGVNPYVPDESKIPSGTSSYIPADIISAHSPETAETAFGTAGTDSPASKEAAFRAEAAPHTTEHPGINSYIPEENKFSTEAPPHISEHSGMIPHAPEGSPHPSGTPSYAAEHPEAVQHAPAGDRPFLDRMDGKSTEPSGISRHFEQEIVPAPQVPTAGEDPGRQTGSPLDTASFKTKSQKQSGYAKESSPEPPAYGFHTGEHTPENPEQRGFIFGTKTEPSHKAAYTQAVPETGAYTNRKAGEATAPVEHRKDPQIQHETSLARPEGAVPETGYKEAFQEPIKRQGPLLGGDHRNGADLKALSQPEETRLHQEVPLQGDERKEGINGRSSTPQPELERADLQDISRDRPVPQALHMPETEAHKPPSSLPENKEGTFKGGEKSGREDVGHTHSGSTHEFQENRPSSKTDSQNPPKFQKGYQGRTEASRQSSFYAESDPHPTILQQGFVQRQENRADSKQNIPFGGLNASAGQQERSVPRETSLQAGSEVFRKAEEGRPSSAALAQEKILPEQARVLKQKWDLQGKGEAAKRLEPDGESGRPSDGFARSQASHSGGIAAQNREGLFTKDTVQSHTPQSLKEPLQGQDKQPLDGFTQSQSGRFPVPGGSLRDQVSQPPDSNTRNQINRPSALNQKNTALTKKEDGSPKEAEGLKQAVQHPDTHGAAGKEGLAGSAMKQLGQGQGMEKSILPGAASSNTLKLGGIKTGSAGPDGLKQGFPSQKTGTDMSSGTQAPAGPALYDRDTKRKWSVSREPRVQAQAILAGNTGTERAQDAFAGRNLHAARGKRLALAPDKTARFSKYPAISREGAALFGPASSSLKDGKKLSFEDRMQLAMQRNGKVSIEANRMAPVSDRGGHDAFKKALMQTFLSAADDPDDMHTKGVRTMRNRTAITSATAAGVVCSGALAERTMKMLKKDLSEEELRAVADIIKRGGLGEFNLADAAKWNESLQSYNRFLIKAGVLKSREGGKVMVTVGKNVRTDRMSYEKKARKIRNQAFHVKRADLTQREKTIEFLMGEFKKSGIRLSKKDAAGLADRLFAHSGTVGNRAGAVLQSKHALGTLSAIRPWSNPLMMEGLKNDPTGQGMQAMAVVDSSMRFIPQAYIAARQAIWMNQAKRYAKELNKLDEQLSSGSLPEKRYRKYEKKQATYQRKDMALRGKRQAAAEKAKKKEAAYQARKDKLKKPGEYLKKQAKNGLKKAESGIKRLPGGTYATRVANRAAKVNSFAMKRALSGASRVFETHAKFHALVTKLILWFAGVMFHALIFFGIISAVLGLLAMLCLFILQFTTTDVKEMDTRTATESTLGIVYQSMQEMEAKWVANIKAAASDTDKAKVSEFKLTRIDPETGSIDPAHRREDPETYVPAVLGREVKDGKVVGPEPWAGAPSEAYKRIERIDGGAEVQFLGMGGFPGYTSNIMEICAMASVAQLESSLTEKTDDSLKEASDPGLFESIKQTVSGISAAIKDAVTGMAKALRDAIPGLDSFLTKTENNTRARVLMAYCKPLFDQSHQLEFGLQLSLLPTKRSIYLNGGEEINQFPSQSASGEGLSDTSYSTANAMTTKEQEAMARQIYNWMMDHGVPEIQAFAILGNMQGESGMNPSKHESGKPWHLGGLGLCQWTAERRKLFERYMASRNTDWRTDWEGQLEFLFYHDDAYDLRILQTFLSMNFTQVAEATEYFGYQWERFASGDTSMGRVRIPYALKYQELFTGSSNAGGFSPEMGEGQGQKQTETKYSHTPNIGEDGTAHGAYGGNLDMTDSVTLEHAEELRVEIWYSTENVRYDWLEIKDGNGNHITNRLGGGCKNEKPTDQSIYHKIYTIPGNTVSFHFQSDADYGYYGYYAVVKDVAESRPPKQSQHNGYIRESVTEYSHTDNIDDKGIANGSYASYRDITDTVTIDGAGKLTVEIWYSTYSPSSDWVEVLDKAGNSVSGKLGGGREYAKPADNSNYHQVYEIPGDTAKFHFVSDRRYGCYGYYAKVTGEKVTAGLSEEAQGNVSMEQQGALGQVLENVAMCPGHDGFGCMEYSGFSYNDLDRNYLYYPGMDGEKMERVYPAALLDGNEWACNAPNGTKEQFYESLDRHPECWEVQNDPVDATHYSCGGGPEGHGSTFLDNNYAGDYGYETERDPNNPGIFYVTVKTDESHDHDEDDNDCSYTTKTYTFVHKCAGNHKGYYCGGHLKLMAYGMVYHITKAQRANDHSLYADKLESTGEYYKNQSVPGILENRLQKAEDLFDIDMGLLHVNVSVSDEFAGWSYDYMDLAALRLEDDWNDLYGIQTSYTIAGINGARPGAGTMGTGDIKDHLQTILSQIQSEDTINLRLDALIKAFTYVGQIGYSQAHHGDPLKIGGLNDCSGYASRVWDTALFGRIYNTDGFVSFAKKNGAYRNYTDGQIQPGDILLHGMETKDRKDNHALIYVGEINGQPMSIDCTSPTVYFRGRGNSYYFTATYIDMDTMIRAYISQHPEADVFPEMLKGSSFEEEEETS